MTCDSALGLLLDAEPAEFSANQATPLGEHLRGCVRCRRVAAQVMRDTRQLAVAMAAAAPVRHPARRRALRVSLAPALAVAGLVIAMVLRDRPGVAPAVVELSRVDAAVSPAPAPPAAAPNVDFAPARASVSRPAARRAFARVMPLAPVRLLPSAVRSDPLPVGTNVVTVTPPAGTRATVMHTSNPKLVVVWLH